MPAAYLSSGDRVRDAERIRGLVAARREREDTAREVYLPAFLSGLADYGMAELVASQGAGEDRVVLVELEVSERLRRARRAIEHHGQPPEVVQAGWGYLDGYAAAQAAYQGRISEASWTRHVV